jgi:hypothetical protein
MKTYSKNRGKENEISQGGDRDFLFDSKITNSGSSSLTISKSCQNQKGKQVVRQAMVFRGNFKDLFPSIQQASTFLK